MYGLQYSGVCDFTSKSTTWCQKHKPTPEVDHSSAKTGIGQQKMPGSKVSLKCYASSCSALPVAHWLLAPVSVLRRKGHPCLPSIGFVNFWPWGYFLRVLPGGYWISAWHPPMSLPTRLQDGSRYPDEGTPFEKVKGQPVVWLLQSL